MEKSLEGLIESAFRFLQKAVDEYEADHEISLVHYATFLELFLKYRLAHEHWTLIIDSKSNKPHSLEKYLSGDFNSINASSIIDVIEAVTSHTFPKEEKETYNKIFNHRNKIVHYYDSNAQHNEREFLRLILKGWAYTIVRMENRWNIFFNAYDNKIEEFKKSITELKGFYEEIYKAKRDIIDKRITAGETVLLCYICNNESLFISEENDDPVDSAVFKCEVCEDVKKLYKVTCDKCKKVNFIRFDDAKCTACSASIQEVSPDGYVAHKEGYATSWYCPECGMDVVVKRGDNFVCVHCGNTSDGIFNCGYCGSSVMGKDDHFSFLSGCGLCEGRGDKD